MTSGDSSRGASFSVAMTLILPLVLLMGGLAVDGAVKARAARHAVTVASAASRAGCERASGPMLVGHPAGELASSVARSTAQGMLEPDSTMTVTTSGDGLTVHVDEPRETIVLNVVGMDHVTGRGGCHVFVRPQMRS